MCRLILTLSAFLLFGHLLAEPDAVLRSTAELREATAGDKLGRRFELRGKARFCVLNSFTVEDDCGAIMLYRPDTLTNGTVQAGDTVYVSGVTYNDGWNNICAKCQSIRVISHGPVPVPVTADVSDILRGRHDYEMIQVCGIVRDAFRDEIDPLWYFLILNSGNGTIYMAFSSAKDESDDISALIGAEVAAVGICAPSNPGYRRQLGRIFLVGGKEAVQVRRAPHENPFDVPEIGNLAHVPPAEISALGRHRVRGHVIAVWNNGNILLRNLNGQKHRIELTNGNPPHYGQYVEAAGLPETDLYYINLTRAVWRNLPGPSVPPEKPSRLTADELLLDSTGRHRIQTYFHGRPVRLSGTVRSLPAIGNGDGMLYLESGRCIVSVNVSSVPDAIRDVCVGCTIDVCGTYVVDTGNWRSNSAFPRTRGFFLVARSCDDIRVVSRPSWWTASRLMTLIAALVAAIAAILVWNRTLRILVERRSRELFKEKIAHVGAELRIEERTRLAVELHDSIAQNLTGVSLQIDAAERLANVQPMRMLQYLRQASASLQACREELRTCLWDLRNQALNDMDMNEAIRRTLKPHLGNAVLSVRFNVSRKRLSDNTAHALLRIIRELVSNAVRHGHASAVKVAGSTEGCRLLFSVRDNGTGFNPKNSPGPSEGHFGLQGIRERLRRLEGEMTIESEIGQGTKVTAVLHMPSPTAKLIRT